MAVATTSEPDTGGGPSATTTPGAGSDSPVLVHVAGSVVAPGVYVLAPGARVRDAVVAAGGPAPDADANSLNLAAVVADGTRVYVPAVGEVVVGVATVGAGDGTQPVGPIDVNRATIEELETLPGVGPATATAIVTERERNGPFVNVDDLDRVPGIGPAKLAGLRDLVTT
jgi:competence protein ComEA